MLCYDSFECDSLELQGTLLCILLNEIKNMRSETRRVQETLVHHFILPYD